MGSFLSIPFVKPVMGILALATAFLVCRHLGTAAVPTPVRFESAIALKQFADSRGLYFHAGNEHGTIEKNFFLADHPITIEDTHSVAARHNCGMTPAWRGVVWVSQIRNQPSFLYPDHVAGKARVWGNVIVAGDEELLNRLEGEFAFQSPER